MKFLPSKTSILKISENDLAYETEDIRGMVNGVGAMEESFTVVAAVRTEAILGIMVATLSIWESIILKNVRKNYEKQKNIKQVITVNGLRRGIIVLKDNFHPFGV